MLYIRSDRPEQVAVYSVTGVRLYESAIPSGLTTIDASRFPKGVLIVATGKYRQKLLTIKRVCQKHADDADKADFHRYEFLISG
jgi:hypothetical protein